MPASYAKSKPSGSSAHRLRLKMDAVLVKKIGSIFCKFFEFTKTRASEEILQAGLMDDEVAGPPQGCVIWRWKNVAGLTLNPSIPETRTRRVCQRLTNSAGRLSFCKILSHLSFQVRKPCRALKAGFFFRFTSRNFGFVCLVFQLFGEINLEDHCRGERAAVANSFRFHE